MGDHRGSDRAEIEARLAGTREEFLAVFQPEIDARDALARDARGAFPQSRTLKFLLRHKGAAGTVALAIGGLVLSRPALALRLVRLLRLAALAKFLLRRPLSAS